MIKKHLESLGFCLGKFALISVVTVTQGDIRMGYSRREHRRKILVPERHSAADTGVFDLISVLILPRVSKRRLFSVKN